MVLTSSEDESDSSDDDGFGILGYAMHSNGGGYMDLNVITEVSLGQYLHPARVPSFRMDHMT